MSVIGATDKWFDADPEYKKIDTIKLVMKDGKIYRNEM
ncbi:prolidase [Vibrio ishigakensis]|uniref:Prolidase n=1 Tax=Vibrio ishigakensis TaxID=1481914 RepID=A0A0B8PG72_9VIBR|nr:prolidase [Vibrio ishigakensis]